ncbi:hypothetical protein P7H17_16690 [Paenibacillus larvae]|nr:hypothetical protein [Paenibacillus larvae]MDT2287345.1 hypothetical protein [Paenibacillus larvae]
MRREIKRVIQDHHGYTESEYDKYGRPVISYGGIPIRFIETDAQGNEIIGFDETGNATSLYAVRFDLNSMCPDCKTVRSTSVTSVNLMRNLLPDSYRIICDGCIPPSRAAARLSGVIKKDGGSGAPKPAAKSLQIREVGRNDQVNKRAADEYITANCIDVQDWLESDTERKKINNRLGRYAF